MKNLASNLPIYLFLAFLFAGGAATAAGSGALRVGVAFRHHESYDPLVRQLMNGIKTARKLFEKSHPGTKISLTDYPYDTDAPSIARAAAKIVKDRVPAVLGGELSEDSIRLGDALAGHDTVLMSPTSSSPQVTLARPFVFRGCFSDDAVADKMAEFTVTRLKPQRLGVFHNVSSPYSDYLSSRFIESMKMLKGGPTQVIDSKVTDDTADIKSIAQSFATAKVQVIAMFARDVDFMKYLAQSAPGDEAVFVGSDGWGSNQSALEKIAREAAKNRKFVGYRNSYWHEEESTPQSEKFRATYQKMFSETPTAWSAMGFDSAWVLFTAMRSATKVTHGDDIRVALEHLRSDELVTTRQFFFRADHSPVRDLFIYRITKDGINFDTTLGAQ